LEVKLDTAGEVVVNGEYPPSADSTFGRRESLEPQPFFPDYRLPLQLERRDFKRRDSHIGLLRLADERHECRHDRDQEQNASVRCQCRA
jgi:hypothetical protein